MTTQYNSRALVEAALETGDKFIRVAGGSKYGAHKMRQNVKHAARRMGVDGRLMVWQEHCSVYIARRVQ